MLDKIMLFVVSNWFLPIHVLPKRIHDLYAEWCDQVDRRTSTLARMLAYFADNVHVVFYVVLYYPFSIGLTFYQKWLLKVRVPRRALPHTIFSSSSNIH
jgi:hypothetical protein